MLSFAQMLQAAAPKPPGTKPEKKERKYSVLPMVAAKQDKAEARYRKAMRDEVLTTPQLASRMGCASSSNISKTLKAMAKRGLVKNLGKAPRAGEYGRLADLWVWVGK